MSPLKTVIADAVSCFPLKSSPEWAQLNTGADVDVERIETDPATITTVDCLFGGEATVFLTDHSTRPARVFGRCDGRRALVERFLIGTA